MAHEQHLKTSKKRGYDHGSQTAGNGVKTHKKQRVDPSKDSRRQSANGVSARQEATLSKALNFTPFTPPLSALPPSESKQRAKHTKPNRRYTGHPSTLPYLPPILSEDLAPIPFTHQGFLHGSTASKLHANYERLEFLGDAYIEVIATRYVYTSFPNLPAGRLSQLREQCVKNETLAEYATAYGFPERAQLPLNIKKEGKKLWIKTMGDIFEAYVAAVILSSPESGFQTAEAWLTTLWEYELSKEQRTSKVDTQIHKSNAKNDLAKAIGGRGVKFEYKDQGEPETIKKLGKIIFHVGVYLTGWGWKDQRLGGGSALSKQEAGAEAAADALGNPLMNEVTRVKKGYDALVAAARERGEEAPPFRTEDGRGHDGG